ncbi:hypothetical protein WN990_29070 [Kitasatospora purpeofusca]
MGTDDSEHMTTIDHCLAGEVVDNTVGGEDPSRPAPFSGLAIS